MVRSAGPARAGPHGGRPASCSPATRPPPSTGTTRPPTARLVAYGISTNGDERSTLHVLDVELRRAPPRHHPPHPGRLGGLGARTAPGSPTPATRAPARCPTTSATTGARSSGTASATRRTSDEVVWDDLPDKTAWPNVSLSRDGRWLLVHVSLGWTRVDVHLIDRRTGARTVMIEGIEAVSSFEVVGDEVIGVTTLDADRGRVVSAPTVAAWHDNWCTLVPEGDGGHRGGGGHRRVAAGAAVPRPRCPQLDRYDHDGTHHRPVDLPEIGSLAGLTRQPRPRRGLPVVHLVRPAPHPVPLAARTERRPTGAAWASPTATRRAAGPLRGRAGALPVDRRHRDRRCSSIRAADTVPGPDTPCVLTGYGGFSVTMGPAYSAAVVSVCDDGGLYAVANIRGGAEEGEAWHRAGMREHKQQQLRRLHRRRRLAGRRRAAPSRTRLAIRGGSNGGLLDGGGHHPAPRPVPGRPDRRAPARHAALPPVPHRPSCGSPSTATPTWPDEFAWLHAYSPYHHVVGRHLLPGGAADHGRATTPGSTRCTPARWRPACRRPPSCGDRPPDPAAPGDPAPATARASR